jgi:hypothetical protein
MCWTGDCAFIGTLLFVRLGVYPTLAFCYVLSRMSSRRSVIVSFVDPGIRFAWAKGMLSKIKNGEGQ